MAKPTNDPTPESESDALLEEFARTRYGSVHEFLMKITSTIKEPAERRRYYPQFIAMVAQEPAWERERDLEAGKAAFKYTSAKTAAADVEKLIGKGDTVKEVGEVIGEDFIAEVIHDPKDPACPIKFLRYMFENEDVAVVTSIDIGKVKYLPAPVSKLVEAKALKLPTGIEEYGTTVKLLQEMEDLLLNFVALDDRPFSKLSSLYALFTWIADRVPFSPYLQGIGNFGQGKTTWEIVMGTMVRRGLMAAGVVTPALLYRALTMLTPSTLVVDEADFDPRSPMWTAIKTILNVGNTPHTPILVNEGGDNGKWQPTGYTSYGPKILATRRPFYDGALTSRCLVRTFGPVEVPDHIPLMLDNELFDRAVSIRNKLFLWRLRNYRGITINTRERIKDDKGKPIEHRVNAIALALLAACPDDDELRKVILDVAKVQSESVREIRIDSLEGRIAQVLFRVWKNRDRPNLLRLDIVVSGAQSDIYDDLTHEKVSAILRGPLGFTTKRVGGYSHIHMTTTDDFKRHMESIAAKYECDLTTTASSAEQAHSQPPVTRQPVTKQPNQ